MADPTLEIATFGAGCFWHVEEAFRNVNGVKETAVGFIGGHVENPSYERVCRGDTGHAEVVQVEYDPREVSYEELLKVFWDAHDSTQYHRQGPDIGTQYRSVIFYHAPEQETAARASLQALAQSGKYTKPIVTEITPASPFYRADEYHQRYVEKHGEAA